jgi:YaiO family outer membrane protein
MLKQVTIQISIIVLWWVGSVSTIRAQNLVNSIETGGRIDNYTEGIGDRYFLYLQYGRKFNGHELLFRLNSAWRSSTQGYQYEVDFYPKFSERAYGYFNIGSSNSIIFPQWRTAAEYFTMIGEKWEASLGMRTIHPPDYSIIAPTGTVGVYLGGWYIYLRPTLNILRDGISTSWLLDARWYWSNRSYLQFLVFRGIDTGAVRDFGAIENTLGLDTYLGRVAVNFDIDNKTILKVGTDYSALFLPEMDMYIKDLAIDITLRRNF